MLKTIKMLIHVFPRLLHQWRVRQDPVGYARSLGVRMGEDCFFAGLRTGDFGTEPYLIKLGDRVWTSAGVRFVTHEGGVMLFQGRSPELDVIQPIIVGNNVFIGLDAIILPGVTIGDNCIIGAGSVVARDIPPGTVAAGVPARPISSVERYWAKAQARGVRVPRLPEKQRRAFLEKYFWGGGEATRPREPANSDCAVLAENRSD